MDDTTVRSYRDIKGWFFWDDKKFFELLLGAQREHGALVELGAYLGRSAVIIGNHLRAGERFVVVDLFDDGADDASNRAENAYSYSTLTRSAFEANYLALHDELPVVVQALSTEVLDHVEPVSARFVHVDASHLYPQVAEDIRAVRSILQPHGIVVFDDFSNTNSPGVGAAVWEAVANGGLVPFLLTRHKMYATWGDPSEARDVVADFVRDDSRFTSRELDVLGHPMLRVHLRQSASTSSSAPAAAALNDQQLDRLADAVSRRVTKKLDRWEQARRKRLTSRGGWVPPAALELAGRWRRPRD